MRCSSGSGSTTPCRKITCECSALPHARASRSSSCERTWDSARTPSPQHGSSRRDGSRDKREARERQKEGETGGEGRHPWRSPPLPRCLKASRAHLPCLRGKSENVGQVEIMIAPTRSPCPPSCRKPWPGATFWQRYTAARSSRSGGPQWEECP